MAVFTNKKLSETYASYQSTYLPGNARMPQISSSISIRGHNTEVPVDALEKPSVVAASLIQTLDWRRRKTKFITKVYDKIIREVLYRLLPLIGSELL